MARVQFQCYDSSLEKFQLLWLKVFSYIGLSFLSISDGHQNYTLGFPDGFRLTRFPSQQICKLTLWMQLFVSHDAWSAVPLSYMCSNFLRAVGCFTLVNGDCEGVDSFDYCHSECQWCNEVPAIVKWLTKWSQTNATLVGLYVHCPLAHKFVVIDWCVRHITSPKVISGLGAEKPCLCGECKDVYMAMFTADKE